ncbi:hypothetical protein DVH24_002355 [Malus domestica]|uniref:Uncharacterized protein n=1 Tax=Malus domestica TaxID=3750 RepID=A0A498IA18_MALDO|nr:hypothetical protein DVH24_002355 [Malus domestica]
MSGRNLATIFLLICSRRLILVILAPESIPRCCITLGRVPTTLIISRLELVVLGRLIFRTFFLWTDHRNETLAELRFDLALKLYLASKMSCLILECAGTTHPSLMIRLSIDRITLPSNVSSL